MPVFGTQMFGSGGGACMTLVYVCVVSGSGGGGGVRVCMCVRRGLRGWDEDKRCGVDCGVGQLGHPLSPPPAPRGEVTGSELGPVVQ